MPTIPELQQQITTLQAERDMLEFSEAPDWSYRDRDLRLQITALVEKLQAQLESVRHAS